MGGEEERECVRQRERNGVRERRSVGVCVCGGGGTVCEIETDAWKRREFACEKVREEWGERERYVCVFRCVGEVGEREIM